MRHRWREREEYIFSYKTYGDLLVLGMKRFEGHSVFEGKKERQGNNVDKKKH